MRLIDAPLLLALNPDLSPARAEEYAQALHTAAEERGISTPARVAAFVAQLAHESGGFRYLSEIWGPTAAQRRYEGRADLGNTQPGDGYRYRGRGFIQLTGRDNYRTIGAQLGLDLEGNPEQASEPSIAARTAALYWHRRGLNDLADTGDFTAITQRINGGQNGAADRRHRWGIAQRTLWARLPDPTGDTVNLINEAAKAAIRGEIVLPKNKSMCLMAVRLVVEQAMGWEDMDLYKHLVTEKVEANKTNKWWAVDAEKSIRSRRLHIDATEYSPRPGDIVSNHIPDPEGHVAAVVEYRGGLYCLENAQVKRGIDLGGALNLCPLHLWGPITTIARLPQAEVPDKPKPARVMLQKGAKPEEVTGKRLEIPEARGVTVNATGETVYIAVNVGRETPVTPLKP